MGHAVLNRGPGPRRACWWRRARSRASPGAHGSARAAAGWCRRAGGRAGRRGAGRRRGPTTGCRAAHDGHPAAVGQQGGLARPDREAVAEDPGVAEPGHHAGGLVPGTDRRARGDDHQVAPVQRGAQRPSPGPRVVGHDPPGRARRPPRTSPASGQGRTRPVPGRGEAAVAGGTTSSPVERTPTRGRRRTST